MFSCMKDAQFSQEATAFKPPYPGWRPYCLVCSTFYRMEPQFYGWRCVACGNTVGYDLFHYDLPTSKECNPIVS